MSSPIYLALIADIAASKQRPDRPGLQKKLIQVVREVNAEAGFGGGVLAAPVTLTAGDEIQALVRDPVVAVSLVQELTDRCAGSWEFPELVFGLGVGGLSTGPIPDFPKQAPNPAVLDGPCFHLARVSLLKARRERVWVRWAGLDTRVVVGLDALFDLMGAIRSEWTAAQGMNTFGVRSYRYQKDLARELGVTPSGVSQSLKAAHYAAIRAGEAAAELLLRGRLSEAQIAGEPEEA